MFSYKDTNNRMPKKRGKQIKQEKKKAKKKVKDTKKRNDKRQSTSLNSETSDMEKDTVS